MSTFFRNIWRDLVDKRLWPVAVILVVALVAIPVVLAKPAPTPAPPPTPAASSGPDPLVATPVSIRSNTGGAPIVGVFKDPFRQQHVPKPPGTQTPGASKPAAASSSSSNSSGGGSNSSNSSNGSGNSGGSTKSTVTKLKVKFGRADGTRKTRKITPGTPLPTNSSPLIIFTDFGMDGTKPVFLISSDVVKTEGDGSCKPSKSVCSELSIKPGGTQFFDVANGDQYQLDVISIVKG